MATCAYDEDSSGQKTPVGFEDSPSQWYTANRRKRAALSAMDEELTQPDSQVTQAETEMASASEETGAPGFVAYEPSQEKEDGVQEKNRLDEEATQIWMTNSGEQKGASRLTSSSEEIVPLPKPFAVDEDTGIGAGDDDAESNMSDDMLEQVGSIAAPSSIADSLQKRTRTSEGLKRICMLSRPLRVSTALSSHDAIDSSGGETEIEAEPKEESPAKFHAHLSEKQTFSTDGMQSNVVKGVSFPKVALKGNLPIVERKIIGLISTTKKTHELTSPSRRSNREKCQAREGMYHGTDRFHRDRDRVLSHSLYRPNSFENQEGKECSDEDVPYAHAETHGDSSEVIDDKLQDILDEGDRLDMLGNTSSHTASRSPRKLPTTGHGRKRTHCPGKQAQGGSIRIILTGLEPTAVIRKKIKSIAGAVYESDIEKATHLIAPQNKLKRTVKLLCGISCCTHIVGEQWLDKSAQAGVAIDEHANCLRDVEPESKWQFDLRTTMYGVAVEHRRRLLANYSVLITNHKSLLPPVDDLVKIIKYAGGKATSKGKPAPGDIVISSEAALATAAVRMQLVDVNPKHIYSSELILRSILQQRVELDKYRVRAPGSGESKIR